MGQKKIWEARHSAFRTVLSAWSVHKSFSRKSSNKVFSKTTWPLGSSGFTLIELVIVIALISVFIAGAIVLLDPASQFQKANDSKRKSDLSQIQKAIEAYYNDFNYYPMASANYKIIFGGAEVNWGDKFSIYMNKLPKDPKSDRSYIYYADGTSPQSYYLYASLERGAQDSQTCDGAGNVCTAPSGTTPPAPTMGTACGGKACNYGVSSSNVSVQ